ncbi:MAG TPA: ATP--guanido phosphotransferase [Planctomycetota bacterium]|nr:ATP--guanido phosphotransferase [Planctomycetota bacterium]
MKHPVLDPHRFAERLGRWLCESGPDGDVVVTSRVRLARNVEGFPFVSRLTPERAVELASSLEPVLSGLELGDEIHWVEILAASPVLRLLLRERHLVSRDLAPNTEERPAAPGRAVAFTHQENISIMVNEEDHLRIQALSPGFSVQQAFHLARTVDQQIESRLHFAHTPQYGYLTCCPTNVGTGLRASVMLHLPALSLVQSERDKVFTAAQRTGLAVRGLYGEGSRAHGDFYQVSNQVTLGRSEEQLVGELGEIVPAIVRFERSVRSALLEDNRAGLVDRVSRSYGMLRTARSMTTDTALAHLSNLRLGVHLKLWEGAPIEVLNRVRVQIQRGHVQALHQTEVSTALLDSNERDRLRAAFLRQVLSRGQ